MRLERGDGHRIVPATFGTTEDREVFEHIHLAQRQGRRMGLEAVCQEEADTSLGRRRGCPLRLPIGAAKSS